MRPVPAPTWSRIWKVWKAVSSQSETAAPSATSTTVAIRATAT